MRTKERRLFNGLGPRKLLGVVSVIHLRVKLNHFCLNSKFRKITHSHRLLKIESRTII